MRLRDRKTARRSIVSRILSSNDGGYAVEAALALPLVLAGLFGVIEFSRLTFSQASLHFACEEATRYAIVNEGQVKDTDIEAYARDRLIDNFGLKGAYFDVAVSPDPVSGTHVITIEGSYDFKFMVPLLPKDSIHLSAASRGFLAFPGSGSGGA